VVSPLIKLDEEGAYRFKVTAADPAGSLETAETFVVALDHHKVPVAAAVSPVLSEVGHQVFLDANGSIRKSGATFEWAQVAGPKVAVTGTDGAVASFVAAAAGSYAFEVTVSNKGLSSPPALVQVFVAGAGLALPVAAPTAPAIAAVGTEVKLDGAGSASTAGGTLQYAWRQTAGPAAGLGSPDRALATAYLFAPGSYEFELTVKDAAGVSLPARVRFEARKDGKAIPVARVTGPATAVTGQKIALDGRGSTGGASFRWTQLGGPWVVLEGGALATFKPMAAGTYVFELEVDDGQVRSAPTRLSVVVTGDEMEN
jgi:hypothetical protein